jgi:PAS domain S-box-containing protein
MTEEIEKNMLRELATKRLDSKGPVQIGSHSNISELIRELSIHQEELEIQNEDLRRTQLELETSRSKYYQWYELAPVGYLGVNHDLVITDANLTASSILGMDREGLIGRRLSTFFLASGQELLYLHFRRVAAGKGKQKHSLTLRSEGESMRLIQLASDLVEEGLEKGFRTILTDVTETHQLEMEMARNDKLESLGE